MNVKTKVTQLAIVSAAAAIIISIWKQQAIDILSISYSVDLFTSGDGVLWLSFFDYYFYVLISFTIIGFLYFVAEAKMKHWLMKPWLMWTLRVIGVIYCIVLVEIPAAYYMDLAVNLMVFTLVPDVVLFIVAFLSALSIVTYLSDSEYEEYEEEEM